MHDLQHRLSDRFSALRDSRQQAVFFIEHGLDAQEVNRLRAAVRTDLRVYALDRSWWDIYSLPLLVTATEVGYRYRGSGTDFWPLLEVELGLETSPQSRQRIKDLFVRASERFRGVRPPATAWAEAFHLIAWPVAHALLPLEFHRPFGTTLANLRASVADADDNALYRQIRLAASHPSARFATLLENAGVAVSLTRKLLGQVGGELSVEIVERITRDLAADDVARRSFAVAQSIQRGARTRLVGAPHPPAMTRTKGSLRLRRANQSMLLEASFPQLEPETAGGLRRGLRRRRFAPQLWGVTSRVSSDQLLSGLPFTLKFTALPAKDAPLFPEIASAGFDTQDLTVLQGFELQLEPPHLFAVSAEGDLGRLVHGSIIAAHRNYWALLRAEDEVPRRAQFIGDVGPLRCFEFDPKAADDARVLEQLGYEIRAGVSVGFAGMPSIHPQSEIPTYVVGDDRLLVPERLTDSAALTIELNGRSSVARVAEVVRVLVEAGEQRVRVSNQAEFREYAFRGVGALPALTPPIRMELLSEERTVQALLGGRLSFAVDSTVPINGLDLTLDLDVAGRVFSATGPLGMTPKSVSKEHAVMTALLTEEVRDMVSGAASAILQARIGHLAASAWELERIVRPCWWDLRDGPNLLSEEGPLTFGIVRAAEPFRAPSECAINNETYLLAPVALNSLSSSAGAPFATLCLTPRRTQLQPASITKPKLDRRRRGGRSSVGLEDLTEAYLRWSLAETHSAIADIHRSYVTARLEEWMVEVCCGSEWVQAESNLSRWGAWGLLEQACQQMGLGRDAYLELSVDQDAQVRRLAVEEIQRSIPTLWSRLGPPSDLDDSDYEALDRAFARAYEELAARCRARGQEDLANALGEADPGESPDRWDRALVGVRERVELRVLAAMLLPSHSATRFMALDVASMTVDDVTDELLAWATSARKAFAGPVPTRNILKACYSLWHEPELALTTDWRAALDTLLTERAVARVTRYLAIRARETRWGSA